MWRRCGPFLKGGPSTTLGQVEQILYLLMENRDLAPTTPVLEDDPLAPYGISEPFDHLGSNDNTPRVKAIAMEIGSRPVKWCKSASSC